MSLVRPSAPGILRALSLAALLLAPAACLHELGDDGSLQEDGADAASSLVVGNGGLSFVSITAHRSYENPVLLAVSAPAAVAEVVYDADGWQLGVSADRASGFAITYRFQRTGLRAVRARAWDAQQRLVGEVRAEVEVVEAPERQVRFTTPAEEGGWYRNDVWFKVEVQGPPVAEVRYSADGWELGRSSDASSEYAIRYRFSVLGERTVQAAAIDDRGVVVATAARRIVVTESSGDTPYFYQYANAISPGATCQNTSIAMVLASHGWRGVPDDITAELGRFQAQSTAGLAGVYNELAARAGQVERLMPRSNGTLAELREELRAGRPVIVHGYFTRSGHVLVALGYDGDSYLVNDPAGSWSQRFQGGYLNGWEPTAGRRIRYPAAAFERAVASFDGTTIQDGTLWYHLQR